MTDDPVSAASGDTAAAICAADGANAAVAAPSLDVAVDPATTKQPESGMSSRAIAAVMKIATSRKALVKRKAVAAAKLCRVPG